MVSGKVLISLLEKHEHQDIDLQRLLDNGVDPNYQNGLPLKICLRKRNIHYLEILLKNGANPNIKKGYPLKYSAENGLYQELEILLKYGADPNLPHIELHKLASSHYRKKDTDEWNSSCIQLLFTYNINELH